MVKISAPGRICLFGEHQDYIKLPVITAAIDLQITITGQKRNDHIFKIDLPDINSKLQFNIPQIGRELSYVIKRDYFRSIFNVLLRHGANFESGWSCQVKGNIPINSGTASSSALCVAWTRFLLEVNSIKNPLFSDLEFVGKIAYLAEIEEFGEPGGMMDHNACALGGILFQEFNDPINFKKHILKLGTFVLGDSMEPKDTLQILKRVKYGISNAINEIIKENDTFKIETAMIDDLKQYKAILTDSQMQLLKGTILNRDITKQAAELLEEQQFNENLFGSLLNKHQKILKEYLLISTPKIDKMLLAAEKAGAYGGKINGSGGGGCMYVYAPENPMDIVKAIEGQDAKAYIVNVIN